MTTECLVSRQQVLLSVACCLLPLFGCRREIRELNPPISSASRPLPVRVSTLQPGPTMGAPAALNNPYEGNAYAISKGQQLFEQYNCSGCHAHGGGGIGPPLMDDKWIYGSSPAQIYLTITEGRPNGMPSFGGHIPAEQVWQLVSYVRSLSGLEPAATVSPRSDEMQARRAEEKK